VKETTRNCTEVTRQTVVHEIRPVITVMKGSRATFSWPVSALHGSTSATCDSTRSCQVLPETLLRSGLLRSIRIQRSSI